MDLTFRDISVAVFVQSLSGVLATLEKAEAHLSAAGTDPEPIMDFAFAPDMKPFRFQLQSVLHHSVGALAGLRTGRFAPPPPTPQWRWADLPAAVEAGKAEIEAVRDDELDTLSRGTVLFTAAGRQRLFTAVEFVLSWSTPNLHFHAATAYDILRHHGVPLGKRDYLGPLRGRNPKDAPSDHTPRPS